MLKLRSFRKNAPAAVVCVAGAFSFYSAEDKKRVDR